MTSPSRIALGTGALFLGGLLGGIVGAWMVSRSAPAGVAEEPAGDHGELASVLRDLVREMERERRVDPVVAASERKPASIESEPALAAFDGTAVVEALDRLTQVLVSTQATLGSRAPTHEPSLRSPNDEAALERLVGREDEVLAREFRAWGHRDLLERFGRPDEIKPNGNWVYNLPMGSELAVFIFSFTDGFVSGMSGSRYNVR